MSLTFAHGPALGDAIYSLPVVRYLCQLEKEKAVLYLHSYSQFREAVSFFKRQDYIEDCRYIEGGLVPKVKFNLQLFSKTEEHRNKTGMLIPLCHFKGLGIVPPPDWSSPWLATDRLERPYRLIVHRSTRYRGTVSYRFLTGLEGLRAVGSAGEAKQLRDACGAAWLKTDTVEQLARHVGNCSVFVGNQSGPLAVAVGLGKSRLLEESSYWADCRYGHFNERVLTADDSVNRKLLGELLYEDDYSI